MKTFTVTSHVTCCGDCPYRESNRDGDSYCSASEGGGITQAITQWYIARQNREALTPTCPMWDEAKEETTDMKTKPVCKHCGSEDVVCDAAARWSVEKQEWVMSGAHEFNVDCCQCNGETRIDWVPADYDTTGEKT